MIPGDTVRSSVGRSDGDVLHSASFIIATAIAMIAEKPLQVTPPQNNNSTVDIIYSIRIGGLALDSVSFRVPLTRFSD